MPNTYSTGKQRPYFVDHFHAVAGLGMLSTGPMLPAARSRWEGESMTDFPTPFCLS